MSCKGAPVSQGREQSNSRHWTAMYRGLSFGWLRLSLCRVHPPGLPCDSQLCSCANTVRLPVGRCCHCSALTGSDGAFCTAAEIAAKINFDTVSINIYSLA